MHSNDVFVWRMSATRHKSAILAFRRALLDSYRNGGPFPVALIIDLLPLATPQADALKARGAFSFSGFDGLLQRRFENRAADKLRLRIEDPVMKKYTIDLPAIWMGNIGHIGDADMVVLQFDPPLLMDVPRISELGVNRSEFQWLVGMRANTFAALSELEDDALRSRKTVIEVEIQEGHSFDKYYESLGGPIVTFGGPQIMCGGGLPTDPDADQWYVYTQKKDGLCVVHFGGMSGEYYNYAWGPGSEDDANAYFNQHCGADPDQVQHP